MAWFKKSQNSNLFSENVSVEVYDRNNQYEVMTQKVRVTYLIDVEFRNFGIKSIDIFPQGTVQIMISPINSREEKTINVDLAQLKVDKVHGSGVFAESLELWLLPDGNVDYKNSVINFVAGI
jgi:hypothetical protein